MSLEGTGELSASAESDDPAQPLVASARSVASRRWRTWPDLYKTVTRIGVAFVMASERKIGVAWASQKACESTWAV